MLVGGWPSPGEAVSVKLDGNYAYLCDRGRGLHQIDISNATGLFLAGTYATASPAEGVALAGDYAFVCETGGGVEVLQVYQRALNTLAGAHKRPESI